MNDNDILRVEYRFCQEDRCIFGYRLELDGERLEPVADQSTAPDWARLDNQRCPGCPLDADRHPWCPAARALAPLALCGSELPSYAEIRLEVVTEERTVSAMTSLQRALSSLSGLLIATSGCPHTAFLKPMARFHLPLASDLETVFRATAAYALAQYFLHRDGKPVDLDFSGLHARYARLHEINRCLARRLGAVCAQDAAVNGLVLLDTLARSVPYTVSDSLAELQPLFLDYLE